MDGALAKVHSSERDCGTCGVREAEHDETTTLCIPDENRALALQLLNYTSITNERTNVTTTTIYDVSKVVITKHLTCSNEKYT